MLKKQIERSVFCWILLFHHPARRAISPEPVEGVVYSAVKLLITNLELESVNFSTSEVYEKNVWLKMIIPNGR
jgi:hypothetical protein